MPWGLKRFQQSRQLHFLTFSSFHRRPNFQGPPSRATFESSLEQVRQQYRLLVYGYVVMPEHIHMLVNEPEKDTLARTMQSLKQSVARRLALRAVDPFWQARYYDFNVGAKRSSSKSSATFTGIRCSVDWWRMLRIGLGAVSVTT